MLVSNILFSVSFGVQGERGFALVAGDGLAV